jgi:hypothetical protein
MAGRKGSRSGRCQGCNHPERVRIERFLAAGASIKGAARKFAIDYHALRWHWRNHVSAEVRATYIAGAAATKDQLEEIVAKSGTRPIAARAAAASTASIGARRSGSHETPQRLHERAWHALCGHSEGSFRCKSPSHTPPAAATISNGPTKTCSGNGGFCTRTASSLSARRIRNRQSQHEFFRRAAPRKPPHR